MDAHVFAVGVMTGAVGKIAKFAVAVQPTTAYVAVKHPAVRPGVNMKLLLPLGTPVPPVTVHVPLLLLSWFCVNVTVPPPIQAFVTVSVQAKDEFSFELNVDSEEPEKEERLNENRNTKKYWR